MKCCDLLGFVWVWCLICLFDILVTVCLLLIMLYWLFVLFACWVYNSVV